MIRMHLSGGVSRVGNGNRSSRMVSWSGSAVTVVSGRIAFLVWSVPVAHCGSSGEGAKQDGEYGEYQSDHGSLHLSLGSLLRTTKATLPCESAPGNCFPLWAATTDNRLGAQLSGGSHHKLVVHTVLYDPPRFRIDPRSFPLLGVRSNRTERFLE